MSDSIPQQPPNTPTSNSSESLQRTETSGDFFIKTFSDGINELVLRLPDGGFQRIGQKVTISVPGPGPGPEPGHDGGKKTKSKKKKTNRRRKTKRVRFV